jgi:hypothetical protein
MPPIALRTDVNAFAHPAWSPDGSWIACNTSQGLALVSPDGAALRVVDDDPWQVFGWAQDSRSLYGIRQNPDSRDFELTAIDVRSGRERIINPHLAPVPPVTPAVTGFSRISESSFATSVVHIRSDIWFIDNLLPRPGTFDRVVDWMTAWRHARG